MAAVTESIDVDVPVTTAYNQWTQFESFPHFLEEVDEIRQIDDTTNHWRVTIGGATREFDTVITEQHPDERVAWKSVAGDVSHAGVVTFHRLSRHLHARDRSVRLDAGRRAREDRRRARRR